jgi:hypothetical protein
VIRRSSALRELTWCVMVLNRGGRLITHSFYETAGDALSAAEREDIPTRTVFVLKAQYQNDDVASTERDS